MKESILKFDMPDEAFIERKLEWIRRVHLSEKKLDILAGYGYGLNFPDYELNTLIASHESQKIEFPSNSTFVVNGQSYSFLIKEGVVNPDFFSISKRVAQDFPYSELKGKSFLEIGPGIGAQLVLTSINGAKKVVGIELEGKAKKLASENISNHNLSGQIEVREGDMFEKLGTNEKFDSIYFHTPYFFSDSESEPALIEKYEGTNLYRAMYDKDYEALAKFIYFGTRHLEKDGYLLLLHSDRINGDTVRAMIKDAGLEQKLIKMYHSGSRKQALSFEFLKIYKK